MEPLADKIDTEAGILGQPFQGVGSGFQRLHSAAKNRFGLDAYPFLGCQLRGAVDLLDPGLHW